ncbi:MAG: TIGR03617 family F420-dependent LLM class oxidoreductase [Chloroflexi bacterium]|nr:TIGR03617 family F420-dependent LLM class oxidoreductase [Chloroflexota bacterium]MDA1146043.1 TIGR03617 family F420-dependent LLM class oxidoreductase [Chloroflexota bacterium]
MTMLVNATLDAADMRSIPDRVRHLEALGINSASVGETAHNPFLPLMLVAEHTQRMQFATSVAIAFPRVPHITANLAWDLANYSGGRFVLGLGTQVKGHNERRFSVPWAPPGPHLRDYVACMRSIWDSWQHGTRPNYEGEYYQYKLTSPLYNPGPIEHPDIKVITSAVNPFNAGLAGEISDGVAIHDFSTFRYMKEVLIPAVHQGARSVGKDPAALEIRGGGMLATGRNDEEVAAAVIEVKRRISFYGSTRSYESVMKLHGWEDEAARLHGMSLEGRWDEMVDVVTDEMLDQFATVGTWDTIAARAREKYAGINSQISFEVDPTTPDEEAQIKEIVADLKTVPTVGDALSS